MKAVHKISMMSFALAGLYCSSSLAATSANTTPTMTTKTTTVAASTKTTATNTSSTKQSNAAPVPVMVVAPHQTAAFVPLQDPQAAYNTSGIQINIYAGWSNTTTHHSNITVDQYETDSLHGGDNSTEFTPGGGVSYQFVLNPNGGIIHAFDVGLDFFNDNYDRTGQVYYYQLPQDNNYHYKANLNSARLLLNGELDFHPLWHGLTLFAEGGVGGAYNKVQYGESPNQGFNGGGELDMPTTLTLNFAYDVGAGVKLPLCSNLELSFRYLYTDPGYAETGLTANDGTQIQKPIKFDMKSNSWLFGLSYLIR
ncbi:MAG: outer membrane beta-barrel protein [Gammaproteobacteria bacterium]